MQNRRDFLRTMGAVALGFSGLQTWAHGLGEDQICAGFGSLKEDPAGKVNLPRGFSYKIIATVGDKMDDGFLLPGKGDGMGTFKTRDSDRLVLIRNHENASYQKGGSPFGENYGLLKKLDKDKFFDYGFGKRPHIGGTTTTVYNEKTQKVEKCFLSLIGTSRNCAGGVTPWNSWLTCEESTITPDSKNEKKHGYVFEVPVSQKPYIKFPVPIRAMGRFHHEAVAVDPKTNIIYLTEDRQKGLFYRFIPKDPKKLHAGGKLQALVFVWRKSMDTRNWGVDKWVKPGSRYTVKWIDLDNVDPDEDDLRYRGFEAGAACFARAEGIWYSRRGIFFACTSGGANKTGQIFRYIPSKYEGTYKEKRKDYYPRLQLYAEPNDSKLLKFCDNLTIAPWGDVIFCEDHPNEPRISGITASGKFYKIACNVGHKSEFAGICFSPSGKTLFVNIQHAGLTLAITGPWDKRRAD